MLELLELPLDWLPAAHERTGDRGGAGDQAAGALGVGIDRPGRLSVVLGTSGVVFAALPAFAADPQARVHAFCHAVPDTWHAMGVMLSAAGSLAGCATSSAPATSELLADAARSPRAPRAFSSRRTSRASARRTPTPMPGARSRDLRWTTTAARSSARCWRASPSACATRSSCSRELGVEPTAARVSGGGARSELWLRIVASVLGVPLERTAVEEGAAFGAALLGGVRGRRLRAADEAVAACVRVRDVVEPDPAWPASTRRHTPATASSIRR